MLVLLYTDMTYNVFSGTLNPTQSLRPFLYDFVFLPLQGDKCQ